MVPVRKYTPSYISCSVCHLTAALNGCLPDAAFTLGDIHLPIDNLP